MALEMHRIDRRLRMRMLVFLLIGVIILGFVVYDVATAALAWWLALIAAIVGTGIGYLVGRAGRLKWHDTEDKVVSQMDIVGIAAILIYVAVRLGGEALLKDYLSGAALSTATLAVLGGALLGRYLGTHHSIRRALDRPRA